ncbi:hypothetical protein PFISCL1PPCAC_12718, partial [Pristionchus fissidentatus]
YSLFEAAIAEVENPLVRLDGALDKCARGEGRKAQYRSLSIKSGVGSEFSLPRARAAIGSLMAIISKNADDAVKADTVEDMKTGPRVRVYYTHDHNVLGVAQVLGVIDEYKGINPEFSSAIAIETWSSSEGFDIKVVMKDGVEKPFKPVAKFRFLDFKKRISPYTATSDEDVQWDDQVSEIYSFAQFGKDVGPDLSVVKSALTGTDSTATERGSRTLTYEILLVFFMVLTVVVVLVRRRNTYTRMY